MSSVVLLLFLSGFVGKHREKKMVQLAGPDVVIGPPPPIDPPPPPPPPPPKPPMPQVRMIADVTPRIVPDDKADAPPPPNEELENAKIGTVSTPGGVDNEIVAPPVNDAGKEVTERPKATEEDNRFIPIEKESEFPGGAGAWMRFLNKNLRTPDYAINNEITGTVVVRFVVDGDGNVSDVVAISGPENGGLREEAIRVIKKSGKWTPALQNGRYVKSSKEQAVTFVLENQ